MTPTPPATRDLDVPLISGLTMGSNNTYAGHSLSAPSPTENAKPSHPTTTNAPNPHPTNKRNTAFTTSGQNCHKNTIGEHIKPGGGGT